MTWLHKVRLSNEKTFNEIKIIYLRLKHQYNIIIIITVINII